MNSTAALNPVGVASLVAIGVLAGVLTVNIAMAMIVSTFTRLPGRGCTRYWAAGLALIFFGVTLFMNSQDRVAYLPGMLAYGSIVAGFILQWQGLRIFHLKRPGGHWREIAAVFLFLYSLELLNEYSYGVRLALVCLLCIVVSSLCLRELIHYDRLRFNLVNWTAVGGCGLMIITACIVMIDGFYAAHELSPVAMNMRVLLHVVIPVLGLVVYSGALVILYFYRIAESTNYAASHDELTGLLNRRAINEYGKREVDVALRAHQPVTVAFVDIDFFKKINDQYGHDTGDMVLKEVAQLLGLTCRSVDLVGRYGGEEFCMVFSGRGDSNGGAEGLGERLVSAVRDHAFPGVPGVTISVGLAVLSASAISGTWHNLVHLADTELYKAKNGGRNRYAIHYDAGDASQLTAGNLQGQKNTAYGSNGSLSMMGH